MVERLNRTSEGMVSYFHVGIIVPDLSAAIARYQDMLGIRFTEPATFRIPRMEDPHPHEAHFAAAFSMTEPPYYELLEAAGDGITSAKLAGNILYYGVWETDMAARLEKLKQQKIGLDALFKRDADSPPFAIITAPVLMGARVEYVDISAKPAIEEWVRTGKSPGSG
jgi:catechol 2,3-dioxygenase-like lactoylglutathione lyase family enzyme